MKTENNLIAFIPLRKGSKSILNKNTKLFLGKPLFTSVLDKIIKSKIFDEIWIATDDVKVVEYTDRYYSDIVNIFIRSEETAQDTSPTIDVVIDFLTKRESTLNQVLYLFQATSPLLGLDDIIKFVNKMASYKYDSALSCYRIKSFRWSEEGVPLDYSLKKKPRRQDFQAPLVETGAIYASKTEAILKSRMLISGKTGTIELSRKSSIDIDEIEDWVMAEAYYKHIKKHNGVW